MSELSIDFEIGDHIKKAIDKNAIDKNAIDNKNAIDKNAIDKMAIDNKIFKITNIKLLNFILKLAMVIMR